MKKKLKYFIEPNIGSNFIDFKISHTRPTIKSAFRLADRLVEKNKIDYVIYTNKERNKTIRRKNRGGCSTMTRVFYFEY